MDYKILDLLHLNFAFVQEIIIDAPAVNVCSYTPAKNTNAREMYIYVYYL